jgi:FtsX-like permease family
MSAVAYRLRSAIRSQWAASAGLAVVIAVVCGIVLTFAAGANRTATAPDRYVTSIGGTFDALVTQVNGGPPQTAAIAALPSVESVGSYTFVFGALLPEGGHDLSDGLNSAIFSGSFTSAGSHLIEGRDPDPNNPSEFVGTRSFRDSLGASLGDHFTLVTYTQAQADNNEYGVTAPEGPSFRATLVGLTDGPSEVEDPSPYAFFSPALLDQSGFGVALTLMATTLQPGRTLIDLRADVDGLANGQSEFSVERGQLISATLRPAVNALGSGLWLLTLVAGIAAIAVLGQLVTRHLRLAATDDERLSAIGFTRGQTVVEHTARAAVPIVIGAVAAVALSIIPSNIFPTGFIRRLEPDPGIQLDPIVIAGAALFVIAILLWSISAVALDSRRPRAARPSSIVEAVAGRSISPTAATGVRFALTRQSGQRGNSAAILGVALIVAGLVAATAFGVSLDRLVHSPASYGSNFDYAFGDNGGGTLPAGVTDAIDADPDIAKFTVYAVDEVRVGSKTVQALGMQLVRGNGAPLVSDGKLPVSEDEMALGLVTARSLGVGVGDTVTVDGATASRDLRVTGIAVLTGFGENEGMGDGALMTFPTLQRLNADAALSTATISMVHDDSASRERLSALLEERGVPVDVQNSGRFRPATIINVERVRTIPFLLAGLLAALAVLSLVHVMITSRRRRRRDFAVLSALGADPGWVRRAIHWQASSFTIVPLVIGLPLGVLLGRLVFIGFAESMGAVTSSSTPYVLIAILTCGLIVLANITVSLPTRRGPAATTAQTLQSR